MLEGGGALQKLYASVEGAGRGDRTREEDVAGVQARGFDADEVQGGPGTGAGGLGGPAVVLYAAHPRTKAGRGVEDVARTDLAGPQRSCRYEPYPLQHERPVYRKPGERRGPSVLRISREPVERREEFRHPLTRHPAHAQDRGFEPDGLQELGGVELRKLCYLLIDGVYLGKRHHAA